MKLLQITAPHFCASILFDDSGYMLEAAPILRWMLANDWSIEDAIEWARRKRYKTEVLGDRNLPS